MLRDLWCQPQLHTNCGRVHSPKILRGLICRNVRRCLAKKLKSTSASLLIWKLVANAHPLRYASTQPRPLIYNLSILVTCFPNCHPCQSPKTHYAKSTTRPEHTHRPKNHLNLTMTISFFDQFASPTCLGIPLMALAIALP